MSAPTPPSAERIAEQPVSLLLPCPFCGRPQDPLSNLWVNVNGFLAAGVGCGGCGARILGKTREEVNAAWNRRDSHARLVELLTYIDSLYSANDGSCLVCGGRDGSHIPSGCWRVRTAAFLSPAMATEERQHGTD